MIAILVFGLVVLSSVCLWLLIEQRKSWKFLIWFIPILLVLSSSTYVTYTSILGFPKVSTPQKGLYLKHFVDEPNWIYLWVLGKDKVPVSYQIVYSRETHNSLEGVRGKSEEGAFMVLGEINEEMDLREDEVKGENKQGNFTIGGDVGFYEWDFRSSMPSKNLTE